MSFLESLKGFVTPRGKQRPARASSEGGLARPVPLSSPIRGSVPIIEEQVDLLKKLPVKRESPELGDGFRRSEPSEVQDEPSSSEVTIPSKPGQIYGTPRARGARKSQAGLDEAARDDEPSSKAASKKRKSGIDDTSEPKNLFTIKKIMDHRWTNDEIELRIKWDAGESTWEPEANIQEDTPALLFKYWAEKGGHPPNPTDPDLFIIFAIRKAKNRGKSLLVEWLGYEDKSWEPRSTVEEAAPVLLQEFESRQKRPRKRRRKQ